ncbi:acyltransferase [Paracoccus caeni]|uniref:Acyltransferase n=1 Tax=Paracoccus caeni TaxID=657651 RepID=A0A934SDJ2_9RHOB|nr:acyltransferase [Paracoccus caeni]MBK4215723.1 acyltransferase [Paracoccus caeni]
MQRVPDPQVLKVRPRLDWIDQARGIGIILVVVGHALRGLVDADILPATPLVMAIDRGIYAFHMPLFFVLAGLIFLPAARRKPLPVFIAGRAERLIWPLFLWTWIFFALRLFAGAYANSPLGWSEFPFLPLPPRAHFWFLWALFLILVIGAVGIRRPVLATLLLIGLFAANANLQASVWTEQALRHLPYFIAGIAIARLSLIQRARRLGPFPAIMGCVAFLLSVGIAAMSASPQGYPFSLAIGLAAVSGLLLMISYQPLRGSMGALLRRCGVASMAIFLAHTIFSGGIRAALEVAGITGIAIHVLLGGSLGVIGPLLLDRLAGRIGWRRILGFS